MNIDLAIENIFAWPVLGWAAVQLFYLGVHMFKTLQKKADAEEVRALLKEKVDFLAAKDEDFNERLDRVEKKLENMDGKIDRLIDRLLDGK